MRPGRAKCSKCESHRIKNIRKGSVRHPCGHNIGRQQCQRGGHIVICPRTPAAALCCAHFIDREKVAEVTAC